MDRRKSILNISASVACKILLLIGSIILRRIFIKHMGLSLNGLNSLYISVIGILSVAELGIGSAISFSMYEPIVRGDKERVASLYRLFKKAYRIIGISVFLLGLIITPLLPYLVKNGENINADIYLSFVIFLLSVALSYTFNAKLSLINAYKNNYISTPIPMTADIIILSVEFTRAPPILCISIALTLLLTPSRSAGSSSTGEAERTSL